jgi:alpha-mannosidase
VAPPRWKPVTLPYDLAAASADGAASKGGFASDGRALPAELLPAELDYRGVRFHLAPASAGQPNAVVARGQTLALPAGKFSRLYLLAASAGGDLPVTFHVGSRAMALTIQDWGGYVGQWDNRSWTSVEMKVPPESGADNQSFSARQWAHIRSYVKSHGPIMVPGYTGLTPGFVKRAPVAWFASHRHSPEGRNEAYAYSYLFAYAVDLPAGARTVTLPDNGQIRVLAATVSNEARALQPANLVYDPLR